MSIARKQALSFLFMTAFSLAAILPFLSRPVAAQTTGNTLWNSQNEVQQIGQVYNNQQTDVRQIVVKIIQVFLGFLALIFLCLVLYAGFRYMTSAGNEEKAREAIKLLTNAVIGLLIILLAWAITRFIIKGLSGSINNNVNPIYPY